MELGAFVDYCIEWNEMNNPDDDEPGSGKKTKKKTTGTRRKATQADWDQLMG